MLIPGMKSACLARSSTEKPLLMGEVPLYSLNLNCFGNHTVP